MAELRGLKVYTKGELTIVTFAEKGFLGAQTFIGEATEHLEQIVAEHHTKILLVDLEGVTGLPSDMLGVLVSLHRRGIQIRLYNITDDVRLILETTQLERFFDLREGDLSSLIEAANEE